MEEGGSGSWISEGAPKRLKQSLPLEYKAPVNMHSKMCRCLTPSICGLDVNATLEPAKAGTCILSHPGDSNSDKEAHVSVMYMESSTWVSGQYGEGEGRGDEGDGEGDDCPEGA